MGANYLDSIKEIKKGGNYLPPFYLWLNLFCSSCLIIGIAVDEQWF
jgi:hypothetical protein